ncbi:MAG: TetR family transcriptional regulator [Gammaproteobacteria bacterium]|nr:TetR family transcriptional regulator [Gammaproteobacteria bacterium]MDH3756732.1 TetR family transcriptional regulator [Gammaproteobacteria bacterium]MDH3847757.1 TetR family transcriptional regulator [Gammaproteobacteria bacterium]MDH3864621.1 TetR family transcriptional regulator [Gammaproteobacteria bacterium]MDH3905571.1 TetR family transcriptional regulator [Gammaproteobacteria bacterium]
MSDRAAAGDQRPARKQQQRSIVTQQKLLDAAIEAFSENGFKGTSTRDIADRAGVHHPLITYHFKNKDQLWRAAADRIFHEFNIALVKATADIPEDEPRARAETFIRTYVRYAHRQPALHKFILQESSRPSARLDWLVENHLRPLFEIVVKSLRELQELGIAVPGDPALLFNLIRVSAGGLLALSEEIKGTSNIDFESKEALDELANMIIRCFLSGDGAARH